MPLHTHLENLSNSETRLLDPVVGIDLGTTHSLVAFVRDGKPEVLLSEDGQALISSMVYFSPEGPKVGALAKRKRVEEAQKTIFSVKRLLGKTWNDLKDQDLSRLPYALTPEEAPEGEASSDFGKTFVRIQMGERTYTPVEISAMILRSVKAQAERALNQSVRRAVITVPAYFNDAQRNATRLAGQLAGLEVLRLVNEPTAAALAYGLEQGKEGLIAVYDLGGGTFDLSILKLKNGIFEVLSTYGDSSLGGDDFDLEIFKLVQKDILSTHQLDLAQDPTFCAELIERSEILKKQLSQEKEAVLTLDLGAKGSYRRTFTQEDFGQLIKPYLIHTGKLCEQALKDAQVKRKDLSELILVGGSTRVPALRAWVAEFFAREPHCSLDPELLVAQGAAIQASILAGKANEAFSGQTQNALLLDVIPLSLGIETYGGLMAPLIPRNSRVPISVRETFTTFVDYQTGVDIHILQGERDQASENRSLGKLYLKGIEPQAAGLPRIEVTFAVDADGILQVSALDLKTGLKQEIEVQASHGLAADEIDKILVSVQENSAQDTAMRKLVEARNEAESVLRATQKGLTSISKNAISAQDRLKIEVALENLKQALNQQEADQIRRCTENLSFVTATLADLLIQESLAFKPTLN